MRSTEWYDAQARQLERQLPKCPRLAVIGGTQFWRPETRRICEGLGRQLATIGGLTLLTGGVAGVGETTGRSFHTACLEQGREPSIVHLLPRWRRRWDYGTTCFVGFTMRHRRHILARISRVYVVMEGGSGTEHEVRIALRNLAAVIPVGRTGGCAARLYEMLEPSHINPENWRLLGSRQDPLEATICAISDAVGERLRQHA